MAEKTNPKNIATLSSLVSVKKISDNPEITINKDLNCLNYSYLVTATDFNNTDEYRNYKIKLKTITDYIIEQDALFYSQFLEIFNHYVQSLKGNNFIIVKRTHPNDDSSNILLSYEYVIEPELSRIERAEYKQYVEVGEDGFVYDDTIQQNNNYPFEVAYMNKLTPGIITAEVLEEYMETTIERIIGVPNTYGQQTPIIDSIKEFVDWFWGYVRDNEEYGSLAYLIRTIEKKDEYIRQLAFAYTAEERDKLLTNINNTFNNLDFEYSCEEHRFLTGIKQVNGKIVEVTDDEGGSNIEVDQNNNIINVNGTQYTLSMIDGKLGFVTVSSLEFDATGGGSFEYGATLTDTQKQISYTISKTATVTINNTVITSPYIVTSLNNTTNQTITVKAVPADNYPPECTDTVSFNFNKYKYWAFVDSSDSLTSSDVLSSNVLSMTPKNAITNGYPTSRIDFTIGSNESKYIYVMIKKKSSGSFTFKIGQGTEPGQNTGGMTQIEDNITGIYDDTVKYQLWRSTTVKTANCNIIIS